MFDELGDEMVTHNVQGNRTAASFAAGPVDHSRELELLDELEKSIFSSDTCPVCGGRNTCP